MERKETRPRHTERRNMSSHAYIREDQRDRQRHSDSGMILLTILSVYDNYTPNQGNCVWNRYVVVFFHVNANVYYTRLKIDCTISA